MCLILFLKLFYAIRRISRLLFSIACIVLVLYQACISNYYLAQYLGLVWCSWAVADVLVLGVFATAFVVSYRTLKKDAGDKQGDVPAELPLGYVAWLLYSLIFSIKIGIMFGPEIGFVNTIEGTLGTNYLKTNIALCSVVFLFLVMTHHDATPKSSRSSLIESIIGHVPIDLLDSVQFLSLLIVEESRLSLSFGLHYAILIVACVNFILPTIMLMSLSSTQFGRTSLSMKYEIVHFFYHFTLNLPMLIIRSFISSGHGEVMSVFVIKNSISVFLAARNFMGHFLNRYGNKLVKPPDHIEIEELQS